MSPSIEDTLSILQRCRKEKSSPHAKLLHLHICNTGMEAHNVLGNYMVPMLVDCGNASQAQQTFGRIIFRTHHSWTSLMLSYVQIGHSQHTLCLYQKMQQDGVHPTSYTFMVLLKACTRLKHRDRGRQIHGEITQRGLDRDVFVGTALIDMYAKCGSLTEAHSVLHSLPSRDVAAWTAVIAGYAEHGAGQEALNCFTQMQLEGLSPDATTFVCILKACGSMGAIDKGLEIHREIARKELERDLFVGNSLVDMYCKLGWVSKAQLVFDKLPIRNVVSWSALIAGYAEHGPGQEALNCFERMQLEGIAPTNVTYTSLLKACSSIKAVDRGRKLHMEIIQKGLHGDIFVGSTLIDMYAKCGFLSEAQEVLSKMPVRNVVSWSALIAGYAERGHGYMALRCFEQMQLERITPSVVTFVSILKACGSIGAIYKGRELHFEIIHRGFGRDRFVGSALVDMYAKCGSLPEAQEVFEMLPARDVVVWSALIAGYAEHGPSQEGLRCFQQMQIEGVLPNSFTFVCILKACSNVGAVFKGQKIHAEILQRGLESDVFVGNSLIDMYSKCGSLSEAERVFHKLQVQNVVSWSALIAGYAEYGHCEEALKCFAQMELEGISPDKVTFVYVLKACSSIGAICNGRELHTDILRKGFENDIFVGNTLVDMYAKCGSLSEAWEVFEKLPLRDVVSWGTMINGYGMNHEFDMAVQCFKNMQKQGVMPNASTFTCLLTACSRSSLVIRGQEFFKVMVEDYGIIPTIDHYNCMVDLLARSGRLCEAEDYLGTVPSSRSIEAWTAILSASKTYGESEVGQRCFQQLVQMNPTNAASYVLMANIYATAGRRDDAYRIEGLRKLAGAKKKVASAFLELEKEVNEFVVGSHQSMEIVAMLEILSSYMIVGEMGVPNLDLILRPIFDEGKEAALCGHAEKLALAFGLLNTPRGDSLHVTKNLRMCSNCHNATKVISQNERREIIVRDSYSVHHFKGGFCSCQDMF